MGVRTRVPTHPLLARPTRIGLAVGAAGLVLCLAAACSADAVGVRRAGEPDSNGVMSSAMGDMRRAEPMFVGLMSICVAGPDDGKVTEVRAVDAADVTVTSFSVVPGAADDAAGRGSLTRSGYDVSQHAVRSRCGSTGLDGVSTLLVELEREVDQSRTLQGFEVDWEAGSSSGTFSYLYQVSICAPKDDACATAP
ncbi:hypothetical protein [Promicromonospora sp. NPDC059942]|uniref:hypothetical protein n=1 Tax=Promicromonospora sp. NPDC059942 TaxID=3347009 RepID=UPI003663F411